MHFRVVDILLVEDGIPDAQMDTNPCEMHKPMARIVTSLSVIAQKVWAILCLALALALLLPLLLLLSLR